MANNVSAYRQVTTDRLEEFCQFFRRNIKRYLAELNVTDQFLMCMSDKQELVPCQMTRFMRMNDYDRRENFVDHMMRSGYTEKVDAFVYALVETGQRELAEFTDGEMYRKYANINMCFKYL